MSKYLVFDKYLVGDYEFEQEYHVAKSIIDTFTEEVVELTSNEIKLLSKEGYVVVRVIPDFGIKHILDDIREKERKKKERAAKAKRDREEKKRLKLAQEKKLKEEQERQLFEELKQKYNA